MKKIVLTAFVSVFLLSAMVGTRFTAPAAADSAMIPVATAAQATRYPWPMFHHNLRHTGYTESPAPKTNKTLWVYTIGGAVRSSPAVAEGVVYVGSRDYKVYALNATTGTLIWSYTTGGVVDSSPAVANGTVYVGSGDHRVYALDATTGALLWSYTTGWWVTSSPAVADGMVFIGGSYDHKVYALNQTTGALIWSYKTGYRVDSSPAVADGVVYVGSADSNVYAFGEHPPHYIVIKSVNAYPTEFMEGSPVSITVVVKNEGNETETFKVTLYYYDIAMETKTVTNLAPGASETLIFNWNTIGVIEGGWGISIKAVATTLTEEIINTLYVYLSVSIKPSILPYVAAGIAIVAAAVIAIYFIQVRKRACFSVNLPSEIVFQQLMNYFKPKYARKYYFSTEKVSTSHIEGKWYFGTSPPSPVEPFPPPALAGYFKIDITSSDGKSQVKLRFSSPKSMNMLALGCFIVGLSSLILLTFGVMFLCFAIAIAFFFGGQWRTIDALQEMKQFLLNIRETVEE